MQDGGPAFPVTPTDRSGQIAETQCGMSLRDWFAGTMDLREIEFPNVETLCEYLGESPLDPSEQGWVNLLHLALRAQAKLRYEHADAMLAEREKEA